MHFEAFCRGKHEYVLAVPVRYVAITPYLRANTIDPLKTTAREEEPPKLGPLFVDMMSPALAGYSRRKQDNFRSVAERVDEMPRRSGGEMFRNF